MKKWWFLLLFPVIIGGAWVLFTYLSPSISTSTPPEPGNYDGVCWVMQREPNEVRVTRLESKGIMEAVTYNATGKMTNCERRTVPAERAKILFNATDATPQPNATIWDGTRNEDWQFPRGIAVRGYPYPSRQRAIWVWWKDAISVPPAWQSLLNDFQQLWDNGRTVVKK